MPNPETRNPESPKLEPPKLELTNLEIKLERVYSIGLIAGVLGLAVGLFVRPVLWMGIASLVLVPISSATLMLLEARKSGHSSLLRSVLFAFAGLLLAVIIGLLLPKHR
jgi:ABC-type Fe3+ transport system permease subunit